MSPILEWSRLWSRLVRYPTSFQVSRRGGGATELPTPNGCGPAAGQVPESSWSVPCGLSIPVPLQSEAWCCSAVGNSRCSPECGWDEVRNETSSWQTHAMPQGCDATRNLVHTHVTVSMPKEHPASDSLQRLARAVASCKQSCVASLTRGSNSREKRQADATPPCSSRWSVPPVKDDVDVLGRGLQPPGDSHTRRTFVHACQRLGLSLNVGQRTH